METDQEQTGQSASGGGQKWRNLALVIVLVLAGGVAAHSVLTRNGGTCGLLPCGGAGASSGCQVEQGNPGGSTCPQKAACPLDDKAACCPNEPAACPFEKQTEEPSPGAPPTTSTGCCPGSASSL